MSDRPSVLAAAFSARQIAESARLAGVDALALDFFGDSDLAAAARRSEVLHGHYPDGFDADALIAALERLADGMAPIGFVYGAGFEDRPELLEAIGARWPILGTDPATQRRLKDPETFAALCAEAGVAHPPIGRDLPADPANWLSKKIGGAGGSHVVAATGQPPAPDRYYQRVVAGERISLAFVAAGTRCAFLGFTRQWTVPSAAEPYRYGGAVGPLPDPVPQGPAMQAAVTAILALLPLVGMASADFVLTANGPVLLEINARAGATLDVFESAAQPLLALHLAACRGELPERVSGPGIIRAAGLAWTESDIDLPAGFAWPDFTRDRTTPPASFAAGQPLCTVVAEAETEEAATALFERRVADLRERFERKAA